VRKRIMPNGAWVHVFEKNILGGSLRSLRPGQSIDARNVGSLIVGPGAVTKVLDRRGQELMRFSPKKIVRDFSVLVSGKRASSVEVMVK
jgi:hypothetical protein